jgi:small subunit ribosomal protein S9
VTETTVDTDNTATPEEPAAEAAGTTAAETPPAETPPAETAAADTPAADTPADAPAVDTPAADTTTTTTAAASPPAPKPPRALPRTERPIQTVGRRKQAIVRVRILAGNGKFSLNGRSLEAYFPSKVHQQLVREPLGMVERTDTVDVVANLRGGGVTGQAGALRLAIARALIDLDVDDRPALKKAGFLTRDPRVKESKKYGLKKARKAPQYSKR